jgi:hypothetical protein
MSKTVKPPRRIALASTQVSDAFDIFSRPEPDKPLSPEFAELNDEFSRAVEAETAAIAANDGTLAGAARLAAASDAAWEVGERVMALELVYVKDTRVRIRVFTWQLARHSSRFFSDRQRRESDRHASRH